MGAWGVGPQENDTALDAIGEARDVMFEGCPWQEAARKVLSPRIDNDADGFVHIAITDWLIDVCGAIPIDVFNLLDQAIASTSADWVDDEARAAAMSEFVDICNMFVREDLELFTEQERSA